MATTITGTVDVIRTDELLDVNSADIRTMKFLTDLLSKTKSSKVAFAVLEAALKHNNLAEKQGGTASQYNHLTNAELTLLQDLAFQVVATFSALPTIGNTALLYYAKDTKLYYYWNGSLYLDASSAVQSGAFSNDFTSGVGWDADTNTPAISDGSGTLGDYAIVSTTGATAIDGIDSWADGDYIWWDNNSSVWRKIDNQNSVEISNRIEFVVNNEAEYEAAYTAINANYDGGVIRLGSDFSLTKDHSFSHEGIVIECDYQKITMAGFSITIVGTSCYYKNGFFDGAGVGSKFFFQNEIIGSTTNYSFQNCRFHKFLDAGTKICFDFAPSTTGSVHLILDYCWVSGSTTINTFVTQVNFNSSLASADLTITDCRSENITTHSRIFGLTGTNPASAGSNVIYDATCTFSHTLTPSKTWNMIGDYVEGTIPLTTKGDILAFSTVLARLGVGADGQVLTADSGQPTGLKWAAATSVASQWAEIIFTTATGSSSFISNGVDYSSYKGYGLKVTGTTTTYHIIDTVTFATNSTITVLGEALASAITKVEVCKPQYITTEQRGIDEISMQTVTDDVFDDSVGATTNDINTPIYIYSSSQFIYLETMFKNGQGDVTNPIVNIRKNNTSDMLSALTINSGIVNSGVTTVTAQRSVVRGDQLNFRITTAADATIKSGMITVFLIKGV